jgi:hypothetical protein
MFDDDSAHLDRDDEGAITMAAETAELSVKVRFLDKPELCVWCWDIVDARDHVVESGWENEWEVYNSPRAALTAGLARLAARARRPGASAGSQPPNAPLGVAARGAA